MEDQIKPHSHWWLIARPDGELSSGTCKYCGETRQFVNNTEHDWLYNGERPVHHINLTQAQKLSQPLMRVNAIVW